MSEKILQAQCEKYLELRGLVYIRIPDLFWSMAKKLFPPLKFIQCSKYLAGIPDLVVFRKSGTENKVLLIELKTITGKLSKSQIKFHSKLNVLVIRDFESFRRLIDDF